MSFIAANLDAVRLKIVQAERAAGRADSVKLIAVSKFHPLEAVKEAVAAGQMFFGENRVQEAAEKFPAIREACPALELHLIGPLQTNKAESAVRLFDVIQTLDRVSLAAALAKALKKTGRTPRLYIEVNVGAEAQKAGIVVDDVPRFLAVCRDEYGLTVSGLMCIPPVGEDPVPHFQTLKRLADQHKLFHVSMGMSGDFDAAIFCGATEVRVGTAIFGHR